MNGWTHDACERGAVLQDQLQRIHERLARLLEGASTDTESDARSCEAPQPSHRRPALRVVHPDE
jgi:hypothetical protein